MLERIKPLPLYLLLIATLGPAAVEKIAGGGVPAWFLSQFHGTLLDAFPGSLTLLFFSIAALEAGSASLLTVGLIRGEFLPGRDGALLRSGLLLSEITFVALAFGQRLTHQFDGAFQLFAYAILTRLAGNAL